MRLKRPLNYSSGELHLCVMLLWDFISFMKWGEKIVIQEYWQGGVKMLALLVTKLDSFSRQTKDNQSYEVQKQVLQRRPPPPCPDDSLFQILLFIKSLLLI